VHLRQVILFEVVCGWNNDRERTFDFYTFRAACFLPRNQVGDARCFEVTWVLRTRVDPQELDLETSDVLLALSVVANDAEAGLFTQVVLILFEEDFRLAFGRAHSEEAADFGDKREFLLDLGVLESRTVNVNHPCTFKGRYLTLSNGPVFHAMGRELSAKTVLNA
jgi:hypothetical protein